MFVGCLVASATVVTLEHILDDEAAAFVWAAAAVLADVIILVAAVAWAVAVTVCLVVEPGPGSAVVLVHVAE